MSNGTMVSNRASPDPLAAYESSGSTSPIEQPSLGLPRVTSPIRPHIPRLHSAASHRRQGSIESQATFKEKLLKNAARLQRKAVETWVAASTAQRVFFVIGSVAVAVIGIVFLIFSHRIFEWLEPVAQKWRALPGGWLIIWAAIFMTGFPPIIGYSTCLTIAGFLYGMPGWFICATANVAGSLASFLACRTVLSKYVHNLVGHDKRFHAFGLTLKHDGVKILIMLRLCPLPYSLSNGALSTFPTLKAFPFTIATAAATPKLFIHVFIGSRLAAIAESGEKMDLMTKIINYASIVGFGILGAVAGYFIYNRTVERARQLELEEGQGTYDSIDGALRDPDSFDDDELGDEQDNAALYDRRRNNDADVIGFEDDDVSLWDTNGEGNDDAVRYQDEWSDNDVNHTTASSNGANAAKAINLLDEEEGGDSSKK
jgi:uncharacterized membrane protein YdjX (TVP38/TMEM64 family)